MSIHHHRAQHYTAVDGAFEIFGSQERFNRILYGGHGNDARQEKFFTFAGDTPIFMGAATDYTKNLYSYYAKNGLLMSGLALTPGKHIPYFYSDQADLSSGWFHQAKDIRARFEEGFMSYELTQFSPWFPDTRVKIEAYPLQEADGFLIDYRILTNQRVIFCAGFGALTDFVGRFEYSMIRSRDYHPGDSAGNRLLCGINRLELSGPDGVTLRLGCSFPATVDAAAPESFAAPSPGMFLARRPEDVNGSIGRLSCVIEPNREFRGHLVMVRNEPEAVLEHWMLERDATQLLKRQIRAKTRCIQQHTPDENFDLTIPATVMALDAAWHGKTFFHGAHGYHTPFLGWRGWYAPVLLGWRERVKTAIEAHLATQVLTADGQERVWYDGADRPDLDHEGTQYHHLTGSTGFLPALLYRNDIYNMQEVALDMILYYLDHEWDAAFAAQIFDSLRLMLDWEERILDPDGDHLYQNFLNTWISDGHSYNGGGCAQSSAYNYHANRQMARIATRLGRPATVFEERATRIRAAVQGKLWLEDRGILAEYIDTVGNSLVHPSPELSTIYLAIDCGLLDAFQAYRLLRFSEREIVNKYTANRHGRLAYSSNWLPKKYSTCGIFPAENACLALAYFQIGAKERAWELLDGLIDAYFCSRNPGLVRHVLAASGGSDLGDLDFTDTSSTYLRLVIEGVWGVRYRLTEGCIDIAPALPEYWENAALTLSDLRIDYRRRGRVESCAVTIDAPAVKRIKLALRAPDVEAVYLNGVPVEYRIETGIGRAFLVIETVANHALHVHVYHGEGALPVLQANQVATFPGNRVAVTATAGRITDWHNSGNVLAEARLAERRLTGRVVAGTGNHDVFVRVQAGVFDAYLPCELRIEPEPEASAAPSWHTPAGEACLVEMSGHYNCELMRLHTLRYESPRPAGYSIGVRSNGRYAWEWNHAGHNALEIDDGALRAAGGVFTTPSGVPFATPATGANVACASIWDNFPTRLTIPLDAAGITEVAVFLIGVTNAMQSGVTNGILRVRYADGACEEVALIHPVNFDDWLVPALQSASETVYLNDVNHGIVQHIAVDPTKPLNALEIEAVANEVIIGILGVTSYHMRVTS